jgi:hypothetical protein
MTAGDATTIAGLLTANIPFVTTIAIGAITLLAAIVGFNYVRKVVK